MISHSRVGFALLMIAIVGTYQSEAQTPSCSIAPNVQRREIHETYKGARIAVAYPHIPGEPVFNKAVMAEISSRVKGVKREADYDAEDPPPTGRRGSIGSEFSVSHYPSGVVSVLISFGLDGSVSVHPWEELTSYNFDLCKHRLLRLDDLFVPHSHYLSTLSRITIDDLEHREYAYRPSIRSGASPVRENFKTFTLDETHLTIVFQQYQIAAGAAGSTSVKIPWKDLKAILRNDYRPRG